jgi:hypothetical protein
VATGVEMTGAVLTTAPTVEFSLTAPAVDEAAARTGPVIIETMLPVGITPSPLKFLFSPATEVAANSEGIVTVAVTPEVTVTVQVSQASNGPVQFDR